MNKRMIVCFCLLLAAPAGSLFSQKGSWGAGIEGGPGLSLIYGSQSIYNQSDFEHNSYFSGAEIMGYTNSTLLLAGVCYRFSGGKGLPCPPNDPGFQYIKK